MRIFRMLALVALSLLILAVYGCGGATGVGSEQGATGLVPNLPQVPAVQPGVSMPQLTGETFDLELREVSFGDLQHLLPRQRQRCERPALEFHQHFRQEGLEPEQHLLQFPQGLAAWRQLLEHRG